MTEQSPENKKSKRKAPHPLFRLLDFAGPYKNPSPWWAAPCLVCIRCLL